jgi:hypothetical protein
MVLFAATIVYYWPAISLQGSFWNDFIEQYFPYRTFATRALHQLTFPFWNPFSFSGIPFFADIQSAVLYPLNLLLIPFGNRNGIGPVLFEYQIIFHIMLAGVFMYLLARDFDRSRTASLLAGITFMFGGFTTAHIFHVTMIHTLPWFAAALLTLRRALNRSSLLYTVATAFALCCIALAGHPQMYLYVHYLLGGYLTYHLVERMRNKCSVKAAGIPVVLFIVAIGLGAGMSSIQLLPTAQLGKESIRPEMEYEKSAQGSLRPYRFITLLAPNFYSAPNNSRRGNPPYWGLTEKDVDPGPHYYWETAMYVGILPLLLAIIALVMLRSPPVVFLGLTALFALLVAMGDASPFYRAAYALFPGFKLFRNPARIGVLFTLAVSLLAAYGTDGLFGRLSALDANKKRRVALVLGGTAAAALITALLFSGGAFFSSITDFILANGKLGNDARRITAFVTSSVYPFATMQIWMFALLTLAAAGLAAAKIYGKIPPRVLAIALPILLLADLLHFGYGFSVTKTDPRKIYESNRLVRSVQEESAKELFRINSRGSIPGSDDIGGPHLLFRRNEGTVQSICLMEGYNPLRLKRQLMDRKDRTLDILNVKYKISVDEQAGTMGIVGHPTALPRARMVPSYRVITNEESIMPALRSTDFDHVNEVVLEEPPEFVPPGRRPAVNASAKIVSWGLNKIVTETTADAPALLVLSEIYYPAWKAAIDGRKAKVLRADYALRAIAVPAGKHVVVCEYRDDSFHKGLIISLAALAISIGIIAFSLLSRQKNVAADAPVPRE